MRNLLPSRASLASDTHRHKARNETQRAREGTAVGIERDRDTQIGGTIYLDEPRRELPLHLEIARKAHRLALEQGRGDLACHIAIEQYEPLGGCPHVDRKDVVHVGRRRNGSSAPRGCGHAAS